MLVDKNRDDSLCCLSIASFRVKVLMMLHEDEDYQRDVGDPDAMDAILNDVKQHPEKLQKCVPMWALHGVADLKCLEASTPCGLYLEPTKQNSCLFLTDELTAHSSLAKVSDP